MRRIRRRPATSRPRRRAAAPSPGPPPPSRPTRRDGPSPTPSSSPSTHDLDPERLLVVGTGRVHEPVDRPVAGPALGELLEAALRALEAADRGLGDELGVGQADDPVADRLEAEVEVERAGDGLEGRREERRAAAAAALGLTLAEEEVRRRGRSGRPAGRARWSRRSPRGGRSGSPRRRRGDGRRAPRRWPG